MGRNVNEAAVLRKILTYLSNCKLTGTVLWFRRLNTGAIYGGKAGDPDVIALVNVRYDGVVALFIEVKKPGVTRLRYEQRIFFSSMEGVNGIRCIVANDVSDVRLAIDGING